MRSFVKGAAPAPRWVLCCSVIAWWFKKFYNNLALGNLGLYNAKHWFPETKEKKAREGKILCPLDAPALMWVCGDVRLFEKALTPCLWCVESQASENKALRETVKKNIPAACFWRMCFFCQFCGITIVACSDLFRCWTPELRAGSYIR